MPRELWLATRKGLFRLHETGNRWEISHVAFLGHSVTMLLPDARDGSVYAALNLGHFGVKLHRSVDRGLTWTEVAVPTFPPPEESESESSLFQIWCMEPAGPRAEDGLWVGAIPAGLFHSSDCGASWSLNLPLWLDSRRREWFGGGYDHPGIHSVCVDPRDHRCVDIAISVGGVWKTEDAGKTWRLSAAGMYSDFMPPDRKFDQNIQDPHRMVRSPSEPDVLWVQHHNGIFVSKDAAASWNHVAAWGPSKFGFAVAVHPKAGKTAWFVPGVKDECRVPVDNRLVVTRTDDFGATTREQTHGLPGRDCYDLVYRHCLDVDETGNRLAFASTTGNLYTSYDSGETWNKHDASLPPVYALRFANT